MTRRIVAMLAVGLLVALTATMSSAAVEDPSGDVTPAEFGAMSAAQRGALYGSLRPTYIERLDNAMVMGRAFYVDDETIYLVNRGGQQSTVAIADISPFSLFIARTALMVDRNVYTSLEMLRRKLNIPEGDHDQAKGELDKILKSRPDLADVIEAIVDDPSDAIVHPDMGWIIREFADRSLALVEDRINDEVRLIESDHFIIITTWPKANDKGLKRSCEKLYDELIDQFKLDRGDVVWAGKLPVLCFWDETEFADFVVATMPMPPGKKAIDTDKLSKAGGFCMSYGGLTCVVLNRVQYDGASAAQARQWFYEVLTHETVHAFNKLYTSSVSLPDWLNEGIAEYMAGTLVTGSYASARWLRATRTVIARDINVNYNFEKFGGKLVDYGVCQSFVRYMVSSRSRRENFVEFYSLLKSGVSQEDAMQQAFGWTLDEFQRRWRAAAK